MPDYETKFLQRVRVDIEFFFKKSDFEQKYAFKNSRFNKISKKQEFCTFCVFLNSTILTQKIFLKTRVRN